MLWSIAAVVVGLAILVWSADRFVDGAAAIAHHLGVSNLIIGITVIGFGTSAPEIAVSLISVLEDMPGIAIGNAVGSHIANIGLILGVTALLVPVPVSAGLVRSEYPLLFVATVVMIACLYDLHLGWIDGLILIGLLILIMGYMIHAHRNASGRADTPTSAEEAELMSNRAAMGWILLGLILLVGSSRMLVWGASNIAHSLGISELVIGLTIVALGTSLPELAASIASLKKSIPDLAIGNIIGSNLFNSLAVVGIPPLFTGFAVDAVAFQRDIPVMVALTLMLFAMSYLPKSSAMRLNRWKGLCLVSSFVAYQAYLYYEAVVASPL